MAPIDGPRRVLYVGDAGRAVRTAVGALDGGERLSVETVETVDAAREVLSEGDVACLICEHRLRDGSGLELLRRTRESFPELPTLFVTRDRSTANDAVTAGATDVFVRRRDADTDADDKGSRLLARRIENVLTDRPILSGSTGIAVELTDDGLGDLFLDSLDDVFYVIDASGNLVRWNEQFTAVTGYSDEELAGMHALDFFEGADRERTSDAIETVIETGSVSVESTLVTKHDDRIPFNWTGALLTDADGEARAVIGVGRDITERKERERQLELAETVFQQAQDAIFLIDVVDDETFRIRRVNPAYERLTGLGTAAVEGKTPTELLGEERGSDVEAHYRECLERRDPIEYEERLPFDGEQRVWQTTLAPVFDDGEVVKLVGATRDLTERREHERQLEIRTRAMDEAPVGITISDPSQEDNPLIYANEKFTSLTGYSTDEILGHNCRFLQSEDTDPEAVAEVRRAVAAAEPVSVELRNYRKDGTEFWNQLTVAPVETEDGEVTNYVGFQQDVTERKQRERQLRLRTRAMDEAPVGITIHDATSPGAPITYANGAFEQLTGYPQSSIEGGSIELLAGAETDDERFDHVAAALEYGESVSEVLLLYRRDGDPFWGRTTLAPVTGDGGETTHFVGFLQDVTEAKEHEQQVKRRLNEFGELLAEDLRLPVQDATQHLEAAKESGDPADIEAAEHAFRQIDGLIEDLATVHSDAVKSRDVFDDQPTATGDR